MTIASQVAAVLGALVGVVALGMNLLPRHRLRRTLDLDTQIAQRLPEGPARDKLQTLIDHNIDELTREPGWLGWALGVVLLGVGLFLAITWGSALFGWLGVLYLVLGAMILGIELFEWFERIRR